jgi:hypothetical protein
MIIAKTLYFYYVLKFFEKTPLNDLWRHFLAKIPKHMAVLLILISLDSILANL